VRQSIILQLVVQQSMEGWDAHAQGIVEAVISEDMSMICQNSSNRGLIRYILNAKIKLKL